MRHCVSPYGPAGGPGEGGLSNGNVENSLKEGSVYGTFLSMGTQLGEPGFGPPLLGVLQVMKGRASLFMGAHLIKFERAHLPGTLRDG
jgi:hypothetical protein